jgi:hypothetical protein
MMGLDSVSDGSYSSWEGICFQGVNFGCELKFRPMFRPKYSSVSIGDTVQPELDIGAEFGQDL